MVSITEKINESFHKTRLDGSRHEYTIAYLRLMRLIPGFIPNGFFSIVNIDE